MITEERVMALLTQANPEPEESFDLDSNAAAYLATLEQRSSEVTPLNTNGQDQKKKTLTPWLVAAAVLIVAGIGLIVVNQDDGAPLADQPEPTISEAVPTTQAADSETVASLEVANDYMSARVAHDGAALSMMFAPGANIDDFVSSPDEHVAEAELDDATGWSYLDLNCVEPDPAQPNAVTCTYLMQNDWGRTLGVGPFDGSKFTFAIEDGKITGLTHFFDTSEFSDQLWNAMKRWVAINYPDDIDLMYVSEGEMRKDPAAIDLWRQHTEEFVDLGGANLDQ